jgi:hypothetical protein
MKKTILQESLPSVQPPADRSEGGLIRDRRADSSACRSSRDVFRRPALEPRPRRAGCETRMIGETTMASTPKPGTKRPDVPREAGPDGNAAAGNRGEDRAGGDEIGAGTRADRPASQEDLTRGAPPKKKKRYSLAD